MSQPAMSQPNCEVGDHPVMRDPPGFDAATYDRAAAIFRALGDPSRLKMLALMLPGERCVSELAEALGDSLSSVSQRLKLLRGERIVASRRDGKHVYYRLADRHIAELATNSLAHAAE